MPQANAILAVNSLDRYNASQGPGGQPASFAKTLELQYNNTGQPCNNFQVGGFGALIYGYIKSITISQIQLQYNIPTVIPGTNDAFFLNVFDSSTGLVKNALLEIPYGFYTPDELAAAIEIEINRSTLVGLVDVIYNEQSNGFIFDCNGAGDSCWFPDIPNIKSELERLSLNVASYINVLKFYRLMGIDIVNATPRNTQTCNLTCNMLYTPYIDIYSSALTKYQRVKDNSTNSTSESSLVSRIYLSGSGVLQAASGDAVSITTPTYDVSGVLVSSTSPATTFPLGSRPFTVVQDPNSPKVIRWSKDETVYALDFQLRDQYGDLIFTTLNPLTVLTPIEPGELPENVHYYTEFQMTLLCVEGDRY